MIETILDSKVKIKVAKALAERGESMQVSDIAHMAGVSKSRASECLRDLAEKGVLQSRRVGKSLVYKMADNELSLAVSKILLHDKAMLQQILNAIVVELKKTKPVSISLFGSSLRRLKPGSDVDVFVLYQGRIEKEKIYSVASKLTEKFGYRVSILSMKKSEFARKVKQGEEFVLNVVASHKLLYGKSLEDETW